MKQEREICSLEYLGGTLATAYKGVITSLVAKDFCMTEGDGKLTLKGAILALPEGNYQASLMREGTELSRTQITSGFFEFEVESDAVQRAANLQIDVIQSGRHIGTFLLRREKADEFFSSAIELSREVRGIDFRQLTAQLEEKPGLLQSAEKIIAKVLSTKKNWRAFSDELNSFSKDLFWFSRDAFYSWYDLVLRFTVRACENAGTPDGDKPLANLLSLIEVPLQQESDNERLRALADLWLAEVKTSAVSLSSRVRHIQEVLTLLTEKLPDADLMPVLKLLVASLKERVMKTPELPDIVLKALSAIISHDDLSLLEKFGEKRKSELIHRISAAEEMGEGPAGLLNELGGIIPRLPDDSEMIGLFFSVIEKDLNAASAPALAGAVREMFSLFADLSPEARKKTLLNTAGFVRKLISLGMFGTCEEMLRHFGGGASPAGEEILFNPEMAASMLRSGDEGLIEEYTDILKKIIIPAPKVMGFSGDTWAEVVNPRHLERVSRFLAIIRLDSRRFKSLLIHVICNLSVSGIFIPDEKLFQREVSAYLNADRLRDNFFLHAVLLKKLPVYYNEVGATGRIRDDSTEIDSWGNDPLLYFLRKQVHVNASNNNIRLLEEIIRSWVYQDPTPLKDVVPEDVFGRVNGELLARYAATRTFFETLKVLDGAGLHPEKLLLLSESELRQGLKDLTAPEETGAKIFLICRIYREIVKKYSSASGYVKIGDLFATLSGYTTKIKGLRERVLLPEKTEPQEELFFKRHIAFGIPSVMGSYHEAKFDAFGEILRTEDLIRVVLEKIIVGIGERQKDFTGGDVVQWLSCLGNLGVLFDRHDLSNFQTDEVMTVLRTNRLHLSQIIDLLRICQKELAWIVRSLNDTFLDPLMEVLKVFPPDDLPERLKRLGADGKDFTHEAADIVMRDIVSSVAGLTELDRVLFDLIPVLNEHVASGADEEVGQSAESAITEEYFAVDALTDNDAMRLSPAIGGKAKNLVYLRTKGLRVPPAVVFPSSWTPEYRERAETGRFSETLRKAVEEIEARTGTVFGGEERPLFLSVRSGSYISMPGILSSVLYCGMNGRTVRGLIEGTGDPWLGWDSYRRFVEHYGSVVYGLDPEIFEGISDDLMKTSGAGKKEDLSSDQLKELVRLYLGELSRRRLLVPDDVYDQLRASVKAVYASWYGERAVQFRKAMGISAQWGTAVTIMQMISGNEDGSGASVFFTRNPLSLEKGIYGDTKEKVTGDDLVSGGSSSTPLAKEQAFEGRKSLEESDSALFLLHRDLSSEIEEAMGGLPQEVEAVYRRRPDGQRIIYVLQTRRMETHRGFTKRFSDVCAMGLEVIGRGAGVNGGQLSGVVTFSSVPEQIRTLREEHSLPVILLRTAASTGDVSLMPEIDGILTSSGGVASHASVLAQKFNLTAIVGCPEMEITADRRGETYAQIGGHRVREGSVLSIDGSTGLVYSGSCL